MWSVCVCVWRSPSYLERGECGVCRKCVRDMYEKCVQFREVWKCEHCMGVWKVCAHC